MKEWNGPVRHPPAAIPPGKRKVRYSERYHTYQVMDRVTGQWRNINEPMARAYIAAGLRLEDSQGVLF